MFQHPKTVLVEAEGFAEGILVNLEDFEKGGFKAFEKKAEPAPEKPAGPVKETKTLTLAKPPEK